MGDRRVLDRRETSEEGTAEAAVRVWRENMSFRCPAPDAKRASLSDEQLQDCLDRLLSGTATGALFGKKAGAGSDSEGRGAGRDPDKQRAGSDRDNRGTGGDTIKGNPATDWADPQQDWFEASYNPDVEVLAVESGLTVATVEAVRTEINRHGRGAPQALESAVRNNKVVAIGDMHVEPNPQRRLGAEVMPHLAKAGATHLALEIPQSLQPVLDSFMRDGVLDAKRLPQIVRHKEYVALLHSARRAGMRLVAVDEDGNEERELQMALAIHRVLEDNPQAKVVFWVGSNHLQDPPGDAEPLSAAELLKTVYPVVTVLDQSDWHYSSPLARITRDVRRPVAVATGSTPSLARLEDGRSRQYGHWDHVIIYPSDR